MPTVTSSDYIWAKSSSTNDGWLPLWLHSRDTLQISEWVWTNRVADKHKKMIEHDLGFTEQEACSLFMVLCGLHDLGKSTPDFSGRDNVIFRTLPLYHRMKAQGFDYSSFNLLRKGNGLTIRHELASEYWIDKFMDLNDVTYTAPSVLSIISSHHGNPEKKDKNNGSLFKSTSENKDLIWGNSARELYEFILSYDEGYESILRRALKIGLSWRSQLVFAGYLSMSDWLASTEKHFPLLDFETVEPKSWISYPNRISHAISQISMPPVFDPSKIMINSAVEDLFLNRFGFNTPREVQSELVNLVKDENIDPHDIFILEAPMGEGKTEASLIAGEILMARSGSTGIFFGLPTMATGEAIYSRIAPYVESLVNETGQRTSLELVHSKSLFSKNREVVDRNAFRNEFNEGKTGIIPSGWLTGKYLKTLNSFVVGTVDTLLMMQLKASYGYWRHVGFSQKVIIVDEVHSMDEVMKHYLEESLLMAGFYECPVILCSATLRNEEREKYMSAYSEGKELGRSIPYGKN